jgi:hypothetical protein
MQVVPRTVAEIEEVMGAAGVASSSREREEDAAMAASS